MRLDNKLVALHLVTSRSKAQDMIKRGFVYVNELCVFKPSMITKEDDHITLKKEEVYVSRGADKLEGFLKILQLPLHTMRAIDIGASTGGFTQVLLKHGVIHIETFDVGYKQMDEAFLNHPKVTVHEQTNILNYPLTYKDLAVIDVSFTSVIQILAYIKPFVSEIICLVKPQFEQTDHFTDVIRNEKQKTRIFERVTSQITDLGFTIHKSMASEILGKKGNQEFFIYVTS
jgi:23S rRNA (cytidine1920-2'-O)/16S rRNA (cytidine1409-2'-O)-methyltransferase